MSKLCARSWLLPSVVCLAVGWMFLGIFQDREFARNYYVFVKHRPSPKVFFYAPLGESDRTIESLPGRFQKEEQAFDEFVFRGGGFYRKLDADIAETIALMLFVVAWIPMWQSSKIQHRVKKEPDQSPGPTTTSVSSPDLPDFR